MKKKASLVIALFILILVFSLLWILQVYIEIKKATQKDFFARPIDYYSNAELFKNSSS